MNKLALGYSNKFIKATLWALLCLGKYIKPKRNGKLLILALLAHQLYFLYFAVATNF